MSEGGGRPFFGNNDGQIAPIQYVPFILAYILSHQSEGPPLKVAFVVQRDVDFSLARMFEGYRQDPGTAFKAFRDYDEAICWARSLTPDTAS